MVITEKMRYDEQLILEFVSSLLKCDCMSDSETRRSTVNQLPEDIKSSYKKHSSDRTDLLNLINRCLEIEEGVETLIEKMCFFEGASDSLKQVFQKIPPFLKFTQSISHHHISTFLAIFADVAAEFDNHALLKQMYSKRLGKNYIEHQEPRTLLGQVKRLCDFECRDPYPLFTFADRIAAEFDTVKPHLESWKREILQESHINGSSPVKRDCLHMLVIIAPYIIDEMQCDQTW